LRSRPTRSSGKNCPQAIRKCEARTRVLSQGIVSNPGLILVPPRAQTWLSATELHPGDHKMATKVSAVLEQKGHRVVTVAPRDTVASLVKVLSVNRIGAAPVVNEEGSLAGIISERDIIRGMAQHGDMVTALPVERLMTIEVRTCSPDDAIVELMEVMTLQRIRHLPVVRDGALEGIVSIGDVVKQRLHEAQSELNELRSYISSGS
jgi:CBS domain-containing protein